MIFLNGVQVGDIVSNPVAGACPYDKATLDSYWLEAAGRWHPDGTPRTDALLDDIITTPDWAIAAGANPRFQQLRTPRLLRWHQHRRRLGGGQRDPLL